jgi:hypothetical protein
MPVVPSTWEEEVGAWQRSYLKNKLKSKGLVVAQLLECLPSKPEFNPQYCQRYVKFSDF